ncbi:hypothetical protein BG015_010301 [Linnemannia schmuckeri]|uniref:Uncharacterized protein n=1 Tax=Linnemannia schmuckeri TaxID=64567 RepID=A0A9P5RXQ5_9FUNG|nr:hypothetical protein BG015_010301 [Linnemannia schmuckeri]
MAPLALSPWLLQNSSTVPSFFTTDINDQPNYDQAAAYLSARILTIGGVILFFLGLCCIGAVLLRFNRHQHLEVQRIDFIKECVLDQDAIHRSLPIRIWPSQQQYIMDSENRIVAIVQQVPKKAKGDGGGGVSVRSLSEDSESSHSRTVPRTLRKGLGIVERLCHRGSSYDSDTNAGSSSSVGIEVRGSNGGIQMTTMTAASSPMSIQNSSNSNRRRGSYAESTAEEVNP